MSETKPPSHREADPSAERRLEESFRAWNAVRARSSVRPEQAKPLRALGFLGRTAQRVRDLGLSGELQRDLFQELIDHQVRLEETVAGLRASEAAILGALDAIWRLLGDREGGGEASFDNLANLRDRHEILRVRQTRLEGALADLRDELAALRAGPSAPALPLTPRDLAEILAALEPGADADPAPAGAVEVSFQDGRAEALLWAARRHFGGRLSSAGAAYRAPNDLWIHVDYTADWNRPILLENAAARLAPSGRFVLVTAPAAGPAPEPREGLVLEEERAVALAAGGAARLLIWRKG